MKKNLLNELNEMKYLFGYRRGKILSEQNTPFMEEEFEDDVMLMEPDVMEPDVKPKTRPRDPEEKPFDPDRDRRERNPDRLPYTDPDTHPQGRDKDFDGDSALEKLVMKYLRSKK
jgi:hypothetical protein